MKKADLRTGHIVESRNGNMLIVMLNTFANGDDYLINVDNGNFLRLNDMTDDMKHIKGYHEHDIMRVYEHEYIADAAHYAFGLNTSLDRTKLLFARANFEEKEASLLKAVREAEQKLSEAKIDLHNFYMKNG